MTVFRRITALFLALILPTLAFGQAWPVYETTYVNDYANVIEEGAEGRITTALKSLREETGVEATVLTIHTRWGFENAGSLEAFATGLFNHWGIGNAETNDGILIMVVSEDREMRIELGSGYGSGFNREAQDIIDRVFIPAFKEDAFSNGIEDGTGAVIARIARPFVAGEEPPASSSGGGSVLKWVFGGGFLALLGSVLFGRRISDRLSRCPQCGARGLNISRQVIDAATKTHKGHGEKSTDCPHCQYHSTTSYTISRRSSSSSSGSFGGGSSSGGGASGRW